jgi:uncharacterized membrane protein
MAGEPDMKKSPNSVLMTWLLVLFGGFLWNAALFAAPLLIKEAPVTSALIYAVFSPVCHQLPERSFTIQGSPLAVCGRCLGIYLGMSAGTILYPFFRRFSNPAPPATWVFVLVSLPIGFDTAGNFLRLWASPIGFRLAAGLIWGSVLPFFLIAGLHEVLRFPGGIFRLKSPSETE